jgi:hypothetical protein
MSTAATSVGRLEPAVATDSGTGRIGTVLLFAGLNVGLAAAAVFGGLPSALVPFVLAFGSTVLALVFARREGHGAARRLLRGAVIRPSRRAWYWLVALPVAWAFGVVAVSIVLGAPTAGLFDKAVPAIVIVPFVVILPAFAEEIAWRGYAVNRLLPTMPPLAAAFVLGVPWAAIHIFLHVPGQMNAGLDWWPTIVSLVAMSVILTWAYVGSGGSVLLTALIHAGLNGASPLMAGLDVDRTWIIRALAVAVIALAIFVLGGFRRPANGIQLGRVLR